MTNFRLHNEQTVNGFQENRCASIFRLPIVTVALINTYMYMCCSFNIYIRKMELKVKTTTSLCLVQMENGNSKLPFFPANGNGKRKSVFLGRQTIIGDQQLCFSKRAHL
jgi:hypothetical protein